MFSFLAKSRGERRAFQYHWMFYIKKKKVLAAQVPLSPIKNTELE